VLCFDILLVVAFEAFSLSTGATKKKLAIEWANVIYYKGRR